MNFIVLLVVVIGAIVGAGFASGKEIAVYFSPYQDNVLLIGIIFVVFSSIALYTLLKQCGKFDNIYLLNKHYLSKGSGIANFVICLAYLVFSASMAAALNALTNNYFVCLVSIFLCGIVVVFKDKGIKIFSLVIVPFIIALVVTVCGSNLVFSDISLVKLNSSLFGCIFSVVIYSSVNIVLAAGTIISLKVKKKTKNLLLSVSISLTLLTLILLVMFSISNRSIESDMPIYELAIENGIVPSIYYFVIWCAIVTTLVSCFNALNGYVTTFFSFRKSKGFVQICVLSLIIFALSLFGFDLIVDLGYKFIGVLSFVYIISLILMTNKKKI